MFVCYERCEFEGVLAFYWIVKMYAPYQRPSHFTDSVWLIPGTIQPD
jgi:hypothetical protein